MTKLSTDSVPFALPSLGLEEEEAALRVLRSGWLTTGKEASAFEKEFMDYTGASHALAVNSATAGLHLVLEAAGLKPGDKVLLPSYTFTSTAEVVRYCGADPVFVDCCEDGFHMDPFLCEQKIRELAAAGTPACGMIPVHFAGEPAFLEEYWELSRKYGLFLLEDAAHCFPVRGKRGYAGTWTDAGVYSFYANKTITTGEGGMVAVAKPEWAERIRRMRLHGINRSIWDRYTKTGTPWEYDVIAPGFKYNMTDLAAAIGREQLKKAEHFLEKRQNLVRRYRENLAQAPFLDLPEWSGEHAWHLFVIRIHPDRLTISRNEFIHKLNEQGIGTSVHYKPLHMMSYYRTEYGLRDSDCPRAAALFERVISLPLFPEMSGEQLDRVCRCVLETGSRFASFSTQGRC